MKKALQNFRLRIKKISIILQIKPEHIKQDDNCEI